MRRVVVVTGGGGGIGAALAVELGRRGDHVVTVDPLVTSDGSAAAEPVGPTTADRIVAAGGSAVASATSVTDGSAVRTLFEQVVAEHGRLDAVVNVAGITRPTTFTRGSAEDWRAVLEVHLDGYLTVLRAALPIMAAAGRGRILGVTSGSGWRSADAGAYGCAKRAVAAVTWELGAVAPPGVSVGAISPIAVTRMVTEALERAAAARGGTTATGGLALGSMPAPEELAPVVAHLVGDGPALAGRVLFTGGSEVAVVSPPALVEVVPVGSFAEAIPAVLSPAEAAQASTGGGNPRLGSPSSAGRTAVRCLVVSDRPDVDAALAAVLGDAVVVRGTSVSFADAERVLAEAGEVDAVVVVPEVGPAGLVHWADVLRSHHGLVDGLHADAAWSRAVAASDRRLRLVTLVDGTTAGGRSRAQAAAQLSRAAAKATTGRVASVAVSIEGATHPGLGAVTAALVADPAAADLSGAELVAGPGWVGLRAHPRPGTGVSLGSPDVPPWFDAVLEELP